MRDISRRLLAAAFFASGCSDHAVPDAPDDGPPPTTGSVEVQDNQFVAAAVRVAAGGTVHWTWRGGSPHNVTFTGGPASATQSDGTYERTFDTAGSFAYHCTIHGQSMSGTVTVEVPAQVDYGIAWASH